MNLQETRQNGDILRTHLREELVRRCKKNPKYSLRAFSKYLGLEPSFLSKILSGQRNITPRMASKLSNLLDLPNINEISEATAFRDLTEDAFQVIAEWYHMAILELLDVRGFRQDEKWIARVLGLSVIEVSEALGRLERLGLLLRKGKVWKSTGDNSTLSVGVTSVSLRKMQRKILEQAMEALEECAPELRDQSAMTMSIDTKLIPEAKLRIKAFRRELCDFLQKHRNTDEVYQLSVSFFPLTKVKQYIEN